MHFVNLLRRFSCRSGARAFWLCLALLLSVACLANFTAGANQRWAQLWQRIATGRTAHAGISPASLFNVITVTTNVDNNSDPTKCSLRQAITAANTNTAVSGCTPGSLGMDTIQFDIGTGTPVITLGSGLPTITQAVTIDGATGGATRVVLDGVNSSIFTGLDLQSTGNTVRSLAIKRFLFGVRILNGGGHVIQNCFIGTNETGDGSVNAGNGASGIVILSSPNNTIGGDTPGTGNVISANGNFGILIQNGESTGNTVQGNRIGTDVNGTLDLGNVFGGINVSGAPNNLIGGATPGARNVIAGNNGDGVSLSLSNNTRVQGNYIGLNAAGTAALSNNQYGVNVVGGSSGARIGGLASGEGNVIAGNGEGVVLRQGANGVSVQGNIIGLNASGTAKIPNGGSGVLLDEASNNFIGGTTPNERNVISGNNGAGISIRNTQTGGGNGANNNVVRGNFIGTDINGTANLGNAGDGVLMFGIGSGANRNTVGGTAPGAGNVIAFNGGAGVHLTISAVSNPIQGNAIFSNNWRGIVLGNGDIPGNDPSDGDAGPNNLQNFPVLDAIMQPGTVTGTIPGEASTVNPSNTRPVSPLTLDFYANTSCDAAGHGEGEVYLGSVQVPLTSTTTPFSFSFTPVAGKSVITATATDANGNTSEFSACRTAPVNQAPVIITASLTRNEGLSGANSTLANITDANQASNTLGVTLNGQTISPSPVVTVNGVTISNLALNAAGALSADVVAACGATNATFTLAATDNFGATTTAALSVAVNPAIAPVATTQPASQSLCLGANATFTVAASNASGYQWRKNGASIPGATGATLTLNSVTAADAGSYDVVIAGLCNTSITSNAATLTINTPVGIDLQPAAQTVCSCAAATFSVTASGTAPYSYQWRKDGVALSSATSASFTIADATAAAAGSYDVIVSGACGSPVTSAPALLTVNAPTVISTQPVPQTVCEGAAATFAVTATGTNLNYQWRKNGSNIAGATASSLNLASLTASDAGDYDVVIIGACGTLTSNGASLTVNPATTITTQPTSLSRNVGQSASFSVTACGVNLTYQWRKNGANISGATASSYTIAAVTAADAGNYDVVVSGLCGNLTSNAAVLTVSSGCGTPVVSLTAPASGAIFSVGTPISFTGAFTDATGQPHTANWNFTSNLVNADQPGAVNEAAGTVSASYTFAQAGVYLVTLTVTNNCGNSGSANTLGADQMSALVVIYDPSAGHVTGGGWINSPAGAYVPNPALVGKANFGFVSKYKNGATVPDGNTEFQFKAGNLNFKSAVYEWLVIAGARAQYKGSGTINHAGDYRFMLTAIDGQQPGGGEQDKFRIKIWNNVGGGLVYDNQLNAPDSADPTTVLGGGSIVIHKNGSSGNAARRATQAGDFNGDGKSGFTGWERAAGEWQIVLGAEGEMQSARWGVTYAPYFDVIVPGDYDGDGQTDLAVFRRANGHWYIKHSTDGSLTELQWGLGTDLAVPADYDGDGQTDIAVWRGATGQWFIRRSTDGAAQVVALGTGYAPYHDLPVPADYDGDGKCDVAIFRRSNGRWYIKLSSDGLMVDKSWSPGAIPRP
jgi:CSLREA domain-containing protein